MKLVGLPQSREFARNMAEGEGVACVDVDYRQFPDGESYVRVDGDVAGADVGIVAAMHPPNESLVGTLLLAETLEELGAARVGLVAPYLAYLRQDERFKPGEGVSSRYVAKILSGHVDWLATVDPHLHRIPSLDEIYSIPTLAVSAADDIGQWVQQQVDNPMIIGPDTESEQWVEQVGRAADAPHIILEKERLGDRTVEVDTEPLPDQDHRTPVVMDDIISSGGTMVETVKQLIRCGLRSPICIGIHGLFADDAYRDLTQSGVEQVVTTNTVAHHCNEIDVTGTVARALAEWSVTRSDS